MCVTHCVINHKSQSWLLLHLLHAQVIHPKRCVHASSIRVGLEADATLHAPSLPRSSEQNGPLTPGKSSNDFFLVGFSTFHWIHLKKLFQMDFKWFQNHWHCCTGTVANPTKKSKNYVAWQQLCNGRPQPQAERWCSPPVSSHSSGEGKRWGWHTFPSNSYFPYLRVSLMCPGLGILVVAIDLATRILLSANHQTQSTGCCNASTDSWEWKLCHRWWPASLHHSQSPQQVQAARRQAQDVCKTSLLPNPPDEL